MNLALTGITTHRTPPCSIGIPTHLPSFLQRRACPRHLGKTRRDGRHGERFPTRINLSEVSRRPNNQITAVARLDPNLVSKSQTSKTWHNTSGSVEFFRYLIEYSYSYQYTRPERYAGSQTLGPVQDNLFCFETLVSIVTFLNRNHFIHRNNGTVYRCC